MADRAHSGALDHHREEEAVTTAELEMMRDNFTRRAKQFEMLAIKNPEFSKGAKVFRRLAEGCRPLPTTGSPALPLPAVS